MEGRKVEIKVGREEGRKKERKGWIRRKRGSDEDGERKEKGKE